MYKQCGAYCFLHSTGNITGLISKIGQLRPHCKKTNLYYIDNNDVGVERSDKVADVLSYFKIKK